MADQEVTIKISAKNLTEAEFNKARSSVLGLEKDVVKSGSVTDMVGAKFKTLGPAIAGAFSIGAVTAAISKYTEFTGKISDLSAKTGIGTEALQRLKYAAEQNGGTLEQVTGAVLKLGNNLAGGNKSAVGALGALGLSFEQIRSMAPDKAFITIGDAIAKVEDPMARSKLAIDLFGKSGAELLPMMTGNLSDTAAAADRLGIVMSDSAIEAGDKFGDTLATLQTVGQSVIAQMLEPMIPGLTTVALWLGDNVPKAITGARAAFDWLIQKGLEVQVWFQELILKVVELGAKIPWLGEKLGMTTETIASLRAGVQVAKNTVAAFEQQTVTSTAANVTASTTMRTLNLDYQGTAEAVKKAANEEKELNRIRAQNIADQIKRDAEYRLHRAKLSDDRAAAEMKEIADRYQRELAANEALAEADRQALNKMLQDKFDQEREAEENTRKQREESSAHFKTTLGQMGTAIQGHFASMLLGTQGFKEGFLGIWNDIKAGFGNIVTSMLSDLTNRFLKGAMNAITGSKEGFAGAFKGVFNGQGLSGALSGAMGAVTSWAGAAMMAIAGVKAAWGALQNLFGGGEEGRVVNPERDKWFEGHGGSVESVAERLAAGGVHGEDARKLIEAVFKARTKKDFDSAKDAIDRIIQRGRGGDVPGAAAGGLFTRPSFRVVAERSPEVVGSPNAIVDALAAAMRRTSFSGHGMGGDIYIAVDSASGAARQLTEHEFRQIQNRLQSGGLRVPERVVTRGL